MVDWSKVVLGGGFILGGVGVGYATKTFVPEKWKPIGYISALAVAGIGVYKVYKAFEEEIGGNKAPPDSYFNCSITRPLPGDRWSFLLPQPINVSVENTYGIDYELFMGCSFIDINTGNVIDLPVTHATFKKNSITYITGAWLVWFMTPGSYYVVFAVWDVHPVPPCETEGTCHRLGEAESSVKVALI